MRHVLSSHAKLEQAKQRPLFFEGTNSGTCEYACAFEQESMLGGLVSFCALLARDWRSEEYMAIVAKKKILFISR